jgi:hypothetical protein
MTPRQRGRRRRKLRELSAPHLRSHRRRSGICLCNRLTRFQIGANGAAGTPGVTAIRVLRMQKDQLQVGHTIHPHESMLKRVGQRTAPVLDPNRKHDRISSGILTEDDLNRRV